MKVGLSNVILLVATMMAGCRHDQAVAPPVVVTQPVIVSSEAAVRIALAHLKTSNSDLSRHDMTQPETVQEIQIQGRKAWRVSWRLMNFAGKGGQLIVIVDEAGRCEQGWGE
jgi:hypothetical protein